MANAEQLLKQNEIIASIEACSNKELKELIEIKRLLRTQKGRESDNSGITIKRQYNPSDNSANDSRYKPNSLGLRIISERKNVKTRTRDNKITLDLKPVSFDQFYKKRDPLASKRSPKEIEARSKPRSRDSARSKAKRRKLVDDENNVISINANKKTDHQSDNTKPSQANAERKEYGTTRSGGGGQRDSNGRFIAKSANASHREQSIRARERAEDVKAQEGMWARVGGYLGDLKNKGSSDEGATDVAGVAAGGVFWNAGKEILEMGKKTVGSAVSLTDFLKKKEGEPEGNELVRPVTRQPDRVIEPSSVEQIARKKEGDETRKADKKDRKLQDENEHQTELLEELLDESKKSDKKSGSMLGKLAGLLGLGGLADFLGEGGGNGKKNKKNKNKKPNKVKPKPKLKGKGSFIKKGAAAVAAGAGALFGYDKIKDKSAEKAEQKAASKAEEKAASKAEQKTAVKAEQATAAKAEQAAAAKVEKIAVTKVADEAAEKAIAKSAAKSASLAAKSIPFLGTAYSAFDGALDHEAHEDAFGKGNVGTQQELSYATMNVLDFGGLTSGVFNLVADGLEMAGVSPDTTSQYVRLDPAGAARSLDNGVTMVTEAAEQSVTALVAGSKAMSDFTIEAAKTAGSGIVSGAKGVASASYGLMSSSADGISNAWKEVTGFFAGEDPTQKESEIANSKEKGKAAGEIAGKGLVINDIGIIESVKSGTKETVSAIKDLSNKLTAGGVYGQDNIQVPAGGVMPSPVLQNMISSDLNIGGANAKVRSFRNNNFGNLGFAGQAGATLEDKNAAGEQRFAKFGTPEEGMRALANQLTLYSEGKSKAANYKKLNTVEDIINLYAPDNENDTKGYIKNLSGSLGVGKNDQLNLNDPAVMTKMIRSIATIEGGNPQVTDDYIRSAIGQKNSASKWQGQFSEESLTAVNKKRAERGLPAISKTDQYSNPESVRGGNIPAAISTAATAASAIPATVAPLAPAEPEKAADSSVLGDAGILAQLMTGSEDQINQVEGLRRSGDVTPLSKEAMEKQAEAKKAKDANAAIASSATPPKDDPEAQQGWFDGMLAWGENATSEQIQQIEGLRSIDATSGLWSMGVDSSRTGGGGGAGGGAGGHSGGGGYGSMPHDYGEPTGYVSQKEGEKAATGNVDNMTDAESAALDAAIDKANSQVVQDDDKSFFESFGDVVLGAAAETMRGAVGYFDTQNLAELGLSDMGVSREILGTLSPITAKVAEHANNSIRTGLNTSADAIDEFRTGDESPAKNQSASKSESKTESKPASTQSASKTADGSIGFGGIFTDALSDTVQSVTRSIDLRSIADAVLPEMGISRDAMSTVSPISDKIYSQANNSIWNYGERAADGIRAVKPIQDSPSTMQTITDYSASPAAYSSQDNESDKEIIKQLSQLNKNMTSLLTETKKKDKGTNPSVISNTPQPQPKQRNDIPLASNSGAMNSFLGDLDE